MEISYFASKYAYALRRLPDGCDAEAHSACSDLRMEVGLLHTFYLYTKLCSNREHETCEGQDVEIGEIRWRIKQLLKGKTHDIELVYKKYSDDPQAAALSEIKRDLTKYRRAIEFLFETDINESGVNYLSDYYWLEDPEVMFDFICKVLNDLDHFHLISSFTRVKEKLKFLKNIISFARFHQVNIQQLTNLLIHANHVAINAYYLISICWFGRYHDELSHEIKLQISRRVCEKIDSPSDPHVRETYMHVLKASKLSSDISALEENEHRLAEYIADLLETCSSIQFPITNDQVRELRQELMLLKITLEYHKEFSELHHEAKTLIEAVVCDAAIIIFSIFVDQPIEEVLGETTDLALCRLVTELQFIRAKVGQVYPLRSVSKFGFPKTNELGSMDFLLQSIEDIARCDESNASTALEVDKIKAVQKDLEFLRCFLEKIEQQRNQNEDLQTFWRRAMELAYRAELVIDIKLLGDGREYFLDNIARDINLMKVEAQEMYGSMNYDAEDRRVIEAFTSMPSKVPVTTCNEDLVGLENEVKTIVHRLTRGSMQLDIVPIVGMGGLGKTTLANKVYNSPLVVLHFHIRAWCIVSRVYSARTLLIQILCSISSEYTKQNLKPMDEQDLTLKLKQVLLRNKYLLVLDDLWDAEAWNLLVRSLPNDVNGSRILITSRLQNLSFQFKPDCQPYHLRQLTDEESWKLLQNKVFGKDGCPANLSAIGFQIAKSCRGLPLAIVVVAGILIATAENCWEEVEKSLDFSTVLDNEYCMKTLELSYSHLPDDMKQCLLYFSTFQEDGEIFVRWLLWAWISEGFVKKTTKEKNLVDVAYDSLKSLIDRSLVMVSKNRTMGGCKICKVHDLVYEFCVEKAKEENFLHKISCWKDLYASNCASNYYRVHCDYQGGEKDIGDLMLFFPNLRSFRLDMDRGIPGLRWVSRFPLLLRVLDILYIKLISFPVGVVFLVHLRYLALHIKETRYIPSTIANLSRLQTLLLKGCGMRCLLPRTIWNMDALRVLYNLDGGFVFPVDNLEETPSLEHLDTLSLAIDDQSSQSLQKTLTKLPSIRRLRCVNCTTEVSTGVLAFDCLSQLVSLHIRGFRGYRFKFPLNLKKLTLSKNSQSSSEISAIGKLPDLEVLKLLRHSFDAETWEMEEGDFPSLRFLRLESWHLRRWTFEFSDNFPHLQKLVLRHCKNLKELPSGLGECPSLEMIEVKWCRKSLTNSVNQIQEEQKDMGNQDLKIVIENCYEKEISEE